MWDLILWADEKELINLQRRILSRIEFVGCIYFILSGECYILGGLNSGETDIISGGGLILWFDKNKLINLQRHTLPLVEYVDSILLGEYYFLRI